MKEIRNSTFLVLACLISLTLLTGCASQFSKMSWGIMQEHQSAVLISKLPPNGKVCISSDNQSVGESIARSIKVWAKEINRDTHITVETSCSGSADVRMSARLTDQSTCPTAQTYPTLGQIEYSSGYASFEVMLHEVGHNWGLCDQYQGVANCADWLEGHTNSDKVGNSVMGSNGSSTLMSDDIEGIKYLANLETIVMNKNWKDFLQNNESSPSTDINDTSIGNSSPQTFSNDPKLNDLLNTFGDIYK